MDDNFIDYGHLIDDAMHVIVKKALQKVVKEGLPGKHHFFISFVTKFPGVKLSDALRKKYPEEMTIVLQHQFEELVVTDEQFSVILSFDNVKERIVIPFEALVAFADPSVKFGLQFRHVEETEIIAEVTEFPEDEAKTSVPVPVTKRTDSDATKTAKKDAKSTKRKKENNVVSMDTFRKK